jgi:alpha-L-fucosidase
VLPVPTPQQLAWQRLGLTAFFHFGMNTFTDQNVGDGTADPRLFNPTGLDPEQWVRTVQSAGFKQGILVAKHHDGFCLWQTKCSPYSVAKSPWMGGKGDVVKAFTDAAHAANFRVGLYLSPLDNHSATSSSSAGYAAIFKCEVEELLTKYGRVDEIWFDGNGAPSSINSALYAHIKQISPHTLIWTGPQLAGPGVDLRWVGNEAGRAPVGETSVQTLQGKVIWYPSEADTSIRPSWFYHANEDTRVKSLAQLTDIFFNTVGRNSVLLLNIPPNRAGVLPAPDVARIGQFGASITNLFTNNFAATRPAKADTNFHPQDYDASKAVDEDLDSFWAAAPGTTTGRLEVDLGNPQTISIVDLAEPIALGERSRAYRVEIQAPGSTTWTTIGMGTAIGQRNLIRVNPPQMAAKVAVVIERARGVPAIAEFGVY